MQRKDDVIDLVPSLKDELTELMSDESFLEFPDIKPDKPLTILERRICEMFASGHTKSFIAEELGLTTQQVSRILNKPHIKEFVKVLINEQYNAIKEGRIRLLNKIIEDKLKRYEESGDLADVTKKDVVDLIALLDAMLKEREKKELGTGNDIYINILNQIVKDDK